MTGLKNTKAFVMGNLEKFFLSWGRFVSLHPYPVILACGLFTLTASLGFLRFRMEHRANVLWLPEGSDYNIKEAWLGKYFKGTSRSSHLMFNSDNILTPESLKEMYRLYREVEEINIEGKTFQDICSRIAIADIYQTKRRRKRQAEVAAIDPANTTEDYYDYWADIKDEYSEYSDRESEKETVEERINFEAYGKSRNNNKNNNNNNEVGEEEADEVDVETLPDDIYCGLVTTLNKKCLRQNFLEAWRYDEALILSASQQEILDAVNLLEKSPWTGHPIHFGDAMGDVTRNSTGHIVGAKAAYLYWSIRIPDGAELVSNQGSGLELDLADRISLAWEKRFIEIGLNSSTDTATILVNANRSFGDISSDAIFFDALLMGSGYIIMFAYTILMLGKLNRLEVRVYLTVAGLTCIGMGIVIAVALASLLGFPYTPMHAILPFLCLGIGIDDMFVIMQCWENVGQQPRNKGLPTSEKIGLALQHAGVSITVTSITDIFAFGVGAVTKVPGLQSFCVCTSIALASIYLLTVSWFAAFLSIDEKRVHGRRDGLVPCLTLGEGYKAQPCSRKKQSTPLLTFYCKLLTFRIYRVTVMVLSLFVLAFGLWGSSLIKQSFDPIKLMPSDSYLVQWLNEHYRLFPKSGYDATIYTGPLNWTGLAGMERLTQRLYALRDEDDVVKGVNPWWTTLKNYARDRQNFTNWEDFATEDEFPMLLSQFLFSPGGLKVRDKFQFQLDSSLRCGEPAPPILASKFGINFRKFETPTDGIRARAVLDTTIGEEIEGAFSFNKIYAAWETDKTIGFELWRNIGLAMVCVFFITLLLLADIRICLMVLTTVILTLVDIVGLLHFWDITIDVISMVFIVLTIGLCVDYSVHIGHAFVVAKGTRLDRAQEAVSTIGLAVFNGGVTTFLALVLLGASASHVFISFFKVFLLTVLFGQFHGLVLFPAMLAMLGPDSPKEENPTGGDIEGPELGSTNSPRGQDNRITGQDNKITGQDNKITGQDNTSYVPETEEKKHVALEKPLVEENGTSKH